MKVRYVSKSNGADQGSWLTVGKEYSVLGVYGRRADIKVRVLSDDASTPALHELGQFEVVDALISDKWIFRTYPDDEWELTPLAWAGQGFWTSYFDGDYEARRIFDAEVKLLLEAA